MIIFTEQLLLRTKMEKMMRTTKMNLMTRAITEHSSNDGTKLSFVILFNYLKQILQV